MIRRYKIIVKNSKKLYRSFDKNVFFSIGENCLSDNILERYHLKSFSSPFASGRSNIEYLLAFEREFMSDFVNLDYLKYEVFRGKKVVRNKKYVSTINKYHETVANGFEFTHHDVIEDVKKRHKMVKRCKRLLRLKNKNIILLYHHRYCCDTDEDLLVTHLQEYADIYTGRKNNVHIFAFTQCLVSDCNLRRIEKKCTGIINLYKFYTLNEWQGDVKEILWALCDDDLLKEMMTDIQKVIV